MNSANSSTVPRSMGRALAFIVAVVAVGCTIWFALGRGSVGPDGPELAPANGVPSDAQFGAAPKLIAEAESDGRRPVAAPDDNEATQPRVENDRRTAESFLEEHWGPRWPAVREWMIATGIDLPDGEIDFSGKLAYEEAVSMAEKTLLFGGTGGSAEDFRRQAVERSENTELATLMKFAKEGGKALRGGREYTLAELEQIQASMAEMRSDVTSRATQLADVELELRALAWESKSWLVHPFAVYGPDAAQIESAVKMDGAISVGGSFGNLWKFQAFVSKIGNPHFKSLQSEYFAAKDALLLMEAELLAQYGTPIKP